MEKYLEGEELTQEDVERLLIRAPTGELLTLGDVADDGGFDPDDGWLDFSGFLDQPNGFVPMFNLITEPALGTGALFAKIDKEYSEELYAMQFSLYIDNIIARIDLQTEAWRKEEGASQRLFDVYAAQKAALEALKAEKGAIVKPENL